MSPPSHLPVEVSVMCQNPQNMTCNHQGCFLGPHHCPVHKALAPIGVFWFLWALSEGLWALCFFLWRFGRAWLSFPERHTGLCPAPGTHPGLGANLLPHRRCRAEQMVGGTLINLVMGEQHQCCGLWGSVLGRGSLALWGLFLRSPGHGAS